MAFNRQIVWLVSPIICVVVVLVGAGEYVEYKYSQFRMKGMTEQEVHTRLGEPDWRHDADAQSFKVGYTDVYNQKYEITFKQGRVEWVRRMR